MMGIDEGLAREIVGRILSVATPTRIVVFGSAARGHVTTDSDIDLLVLQDGTCDLRAERARIRQVLRGLERPFDIIVMATERFEETKDIVGGVAYPASRHGTVVYETG